MEYDSSYLVTVSYLEIYNEEVRDLLGKDRDKSLEVRALTRTTMAIGCDARLKNVPMSVSMPMAYWLTLAIQRRKWSHSCVLAVAIVRSPVR